MAEKYRRGRGAFGGALAGINAGFDDDNKMRHEIAKMQYRAALTDQTNQNQFERKSGFEIEKLKAQNMYERIITENKEDKKLAVDFPDQYQPRRPVEAQEGNVLPPEELQRMNKVYEDIRKERSRRLQNKERNANDIIDALLKGQSQE